jgi:hypothetical protein
MTEIETKNIECPHEQGCKIHSNLETGEVWVTCNGVRNEFHSCMHSSDGSETVTFTVFGTGQKDHRCFTLRSKKICVGAKELRSRLFSHEPIYLDNGNWRERDDSDEE